MPKMFLLDYGEPKKNGKEYKILTLFDPTALRQKVFSKFVNEKPSDKVLAKLVTVKDFADLEQVEVEVDMQGNLLSIE